MQAALKPNLNSVTMRRISMKKIIAVILMSVMVFSSLMVSASAANTADSAIVQFKIHFLTYRNTSARQKQNSTPVYFYCTKANNTSVRVKTLGSSSAETDSLENLTYSDGTRCSFVKCYVGTKYSIHNYIHESGYSYARLSITSKWVDGDVISGYWSPDSAGTYTSPDIHTTDQASPAPEV